MNTHDPPGPGFTAPVAPMRAKESFASFTPTPLGKKLYRLILLKKHNNSQRK
jgi:hypothetical protein